MTYAPVRLFVVAAFLSIFLLPTLAFAATASTTPTCRLTASASSVTLGNTVNLTWISTNSAGGTITSLGSVGPSGTQGVIPTGTGTTYVGTFTGSNGAIATCSVRVTIYTGGGGGGASGGTFTPGTYNPDTKTFTPDIYKPDTKKFEPGTYTAPASTAVTPTTPADNTGGSYGGGSDAAYGAYPSGLVPCGATPPGDPIKYFMYATECGLCNLGQLIQNLINYMLALAIPISVVLFAYVGVLYFGSAANPEGIAKAKGIFKTTFIGLLVALAAYLIVQLLLSALLNTKFLDVNNWKTLKCASNEDRPRSATVADIFANWTTSKSTSDATTGGTSGTKGAGSTKQCADDNIGCSVSALQTTQYDSKGNAINLTSSQANALSCIANTESSGISTKVNKDSKACGTFQILPINWSKSVNHGTGCSAATSCQDAGCNLQTAEIMFTNSKGYSDWTGTYKGVVFNPGARTCVEKYDPGAVTW